MKTIEQKEKILQDIYGKIPDNTSESSMRAGTDLPRKQPRHSPDHLAEHGPP